MLCLLLLNGCKQESKIQEIQQNDTINYQITDLTLVQQLKDTSDDHYLYSRVLDDKLMIIKYEYLRDSQGAVNGVLDKAILEYDIKKDELRPIDFKLDYDGNISDIIKVNDLYFYVIYSCKDGMLTNKIYYDKGDLSNLLFETNSKTSAIEPPSVVVHNDKIYFTLSDYKDKEIDLGRGYVEYLNLKLYCFDYGKINEVYSFNEPLYGFYFDDSYPLTMLAFKQDGMHLMSIDDNLIEDIKTEEFDGVVSFDQKVFGIHDNWGTTERELYIEEVKNNQKYYLPNRMEVYKVMENAVITKEFYGSSLIVSDGSNLSYLDLSDELNDVNNIIKVDDKSVLLLDLSKARLFELNTSLNDR